MGQQHRVRAKRKRRKTYLRRRRASIKLTRREASKPKAKKHSPATE